MEIFLRPVKFNLLQHLRNDGDVGGHHRIASVEDLVRDVFFRSKLKSEPADECGGVEALPRIMRDSAVAVEVTLIAVETDAAPIPDTGRLYAQHRQMPIFVLAHVLLAYLFPLYLARDSPNVAIDGHPIYLAAVFPIASCGLLGYGCSETKRIGDIFDLLCKGAVLLDYFIAVPACIAVSVKQTGKQFQSVVFAVGYVFLWDMLLYM